MRKIWIFHSLILFIICNGNIYAQTSSLKEAKIEQELSKPNLPELPESSELEKLNSENENSLEAMEIDSDTVVKAERLNPNDGKPYFVFSTSMAPFQVSLGILKYFIPEWWGQFELNLTFLPSVPVENYYASASLYRPYIAFRVMTGYSFYAYKIFEISLLTTVQFVFISSSDVPFIPTLGFRFVFDFFWMDIGVGYAVTIGAEKQLFKGFYPAITLGFRF